MYDYDDDDDHQRRGPDTISFYLACFISQSQSSFDVSGEKWWLRER